MKSRNQYLKELRTEYLKTKSKKKRGELLDEAIKRTILDRKYLIVKLKPKSNLDKSLSERKRREEYEKAKKRKSEKGDGSLLVGELGILFK